MANISNSQDVLYSRDIEERINELESEISDLRDELAEEPDARIRAADTIQDEIAELEEELKPLLALRGEAEGYCCWKDGETLIRESYFEEYAQELAEDLGYIKHDIGWPYTCIDWERAAKELMYDYSTVDFDGVDYLVRNC